MRKYLLLTVLAAVFAGCATIPEPELTADQVRQIDLSTGAEGATILIKARPAGQQQLTTFYQIDIEGQDPVLVFKESNTAIRLDPGTYTLKVSAVLGKDKTVAEGDFFGRTSQKVLKLKPGERVVLEYSGPFWMGESGRLYVK